MAILCRFGEITLKGNNRSVFEKKLLSNINRACGQHTFDIRKAQARFIIEADPDIERKLLPELQLVFGLSSVSQAQKVAEALLPAALDACVEKKQFSTFRISVQRLNKEGKTSPELERELGAYVQEKHGKKVSLKQFDLELCVEVIDGYYVFTERIPCAGGLPLGSEGTVLAYIRDRSDTYAAWLLMKRGCYVVPVALKTQDIALLKKYHNPYDLVQIEDIQEIHALARKYNALAIVQGLASLSAPLDIPVFQPLAGLGKQDVEERIALL